MRRCVTRSYLLLPMLRLLVNLLLWNMLLLVNLLLWNVLRHLLELLGYVLLAVLLNMPVLWHLTMLGHLTMGRGNILLRRHSRRHSNRLLVLGHCSTHNTQ